MLEGAIGVGSIAATLTGEHQVLVELNPRARLAKSLPSSIFESLHDANTNFNVDKEALGITGSYGLKGGKYPGAAGGYNARFDPNETSSPTSSYNLKKSQSLPSVAFPVAAIGLIREATGEEDDDRFDSGRGFGKLNVPKQMGVTKGISDGSKEDEEGDVVGHMLSDANVYQ